MYDIKSDKITEDLIMILNFRIKNVLSFKDLQEFSMVAGPTTKISNRLKRCDNLNVLKFSAIYGANASGKTNLINALTIMQNIVLKSLPNYPLDCYYKFQEQENMEPSYFEVTLLIGNEIYAYGFEIDFTNNVIVDEWLYKIKNNTETKVFERSTKELNISFGTFFEKKVLEKLNFYKADFINNKTSLLLSFLNNEKPSLYEFDSTKVIKQVYNWFVNGLDIADPDTMITSIDYFKMKDKLDELSKFMKYFDTGIKKIEKEEMPFKAASKEITTNFIEEIKEESLIKMNKNKDLKEIGNLVRVAKNFWIIKVSNIGELSFEKICFYHENDKKYVMDLYDESDGTVRILDLAGVLLNDESDKVFIIDELDRCLHPQLTCKFVELFLKKASNEKNNNQLIVTTHESRLMNLDLLRRDEIWFVNKENNYSSLYSLEEYNVRFDKKIDRAYIEGRYGGVPIFDGILLEDIVHYENKD